MKSFGSEAPRGDFFFALRAKLQKKVSKFSSKFGLRDFDPKDFSISHIDVEIDNLPVSFRNYRIVHISDLHYGQWLYSSRLGGVVDMINSLDPDVVAITGDFVSYVIDDSVEDMATYLRRLKPRDVTVAVLGNHDYWAGANRVRDILAKSNIYDISNSSYIVHRGSSWLTFAGVDSASVKKDDLDLVLKGMPAEGPAILLGHEPDFADKSSATNRFSLQLSGHSHGGQFVIPGFGTPVRGKGFMKYPLGEYKVGNMVLYVNRGLGTNAYWFRINAPPEIAVITLEAA